MKKILVMSVAVLMLASLMGACTMEGAPTGTEASASTAAEATEAGTEATTEPDAGKPDYSDITVAWVSPLIAHEFYAYAKQGMEDCGKEYGFKTYWTGADDHTSEKMIEAMEACIADGVDAIGTVPLSESAWTPILQRCVDEGIPVAAAACEVSENLRVGFVGTDNYAVGLKMIEEAHKAVGTDEVYVGILMSNLDTANQLIQKQAVEDYIAEKGLTGGVVDVRATQGDANTALDVSSSMFAAYPEINICLSFTGEGGASAAQSAAEVNRDICIIGMDNSELTLTAIANGTQYASMAQNCYKWGYYSTKMAFLAAVGRLDEMESTKIDSGVVMITKDNLDTYSEELFIMP